MDQIDLTRKAVLQMLDLQDEAFFAAGALMKKHGFTDQDQHMPLVALQFMAYFQEIVAFTTQAPSNVVETRFIGTEDLLRELRSRRAKGEKEDEHGAG